jgi:serralysin
MANGIQIPASGYQDIDGVLWGWCWQINQPNNHTLLTYNFPTDPTGYGYHGSGFQAFNATQRAAATKALAMYDAVCNLDFQFTSDTSQANIRMAEADSIIADGVDFPIETGFGIAPDPNFLSAPYHGDTWFNHESYNKPVLGSFAFASGIMHELGHALGLKHGHQVVDVKDVNGDIVYYNPALSFDHDSIEYSIMTYRSYPGADISNGNIDAIEFPSTLMQCDILALQYLYGANYDHNSGNTVYTFDPKTGAMYINGKSQGATYHSKIFLTIWDGGGSDTINFANYKSNAVIDLAPGAWSTPWSKQLADLDITDPGTRFARGCIANAQLFGNEGWIENGIGGSGNDSISGNAVSNALIGNAGNDYLAGFGGIDALIGGKGTDLMFGGADTDVFLFRSAKESRGGAGHDTIFDFSQFDGDLINLAKFDANSKKHGVQHFTFIDDLGFSHKAGQLRFADSLLQGDVNGDGRVDFEVYISAADISIDDLILR